MQPSELIEYLHANAVTDPGEKAASNELVELIRKLRWMGMEEEAKTAENQLALCTSPVADSVVARSRETD